MSEHIHDCPIEGCTGYSTCSVEGCEEPQEAPCRECLLKTLQEWKDEAAEKEADVAHWMREANAQAKLAADLKEEAEVLALLVEELRKDADKAMAAMDYGRDDSRWVPGETALDALIRERDNLRDENERLRGITPELPPRPPEGEDLPRYGLRWNGPDQPVAVPMPDGYWTPWYLAEKAIKALEERWEAEVGHANRHCRNAREASAENTKLRAIIARSKLPCLYCGQTEMSLCERGFPGCGRMDDIMADEFEGDSKEGV